jgi:1,3-beta-glucanosyltransferase GAS1
VSVSGNTVSKLPDFENLSSQMAKVTPSGVQMNAYTPTNTDARACPTTGSAWGAATNLPPTPNEQLCGCMVKALSCVTSNQVSENNYNQLFGTVCGLVDGVCAGITSNATTGTYGAYGMCNAKEQLDYAFNAYYQDQTNKGNGASACVFSGAATTQNAVKPTGNCEALISQAGSGGTGTVTSQPSGTGGSSSGSGSSASKSGPAGITTIPSLDLGMLHIGAYIFCAALAGMGMILL